MPGLSCPHCGAHVDLEGFYAKHRWRDLERAEEIVEAIVVCDEGHPSRYGDLLAGGREDQATC